MQAKTDWLRIRIEPGKIDKLRTVATEHGYRWYTAMIREIVDQMITGQLTPPAREEVNQK